MRVARPGFSEIFGGIGWLVGLAGIALYFRDVGVKAGSV